MGGCAGWAFIGDTGKTPGRAGGVVSWHVAVRDDLLYG